ncbi:zinc-dependent metalloprotease [Taibaiella soli]|uniref:Fibronectin type-III domain-containing protein n=1 Tax=Taibaiella soli TaxID=1649169 RepID=A0A2W2BTN9_9BACT|nr:zinc-dependent metalloprotease [Taibaiella soli]PZF71163.1 hypothetical protein DN068_19500 [Taibaiella soli]
MVQKLLIVFLLVLSTFNLRAQEICGFDDVQSRMKVTDTAYRKYVENFERQWAELNRLKQNSRYVIDVNSDTVYEIPIVVHVIHTGGAPGSQDNPSDAQITAWIDYLNEVYATTYFAYPGPSNGGTYIPIRFTLAKRTATCDSTNGIVHFDASNNAAYVANGLNLSGTTGVDESVVLGWSRWDPNMYYNIYVVNKIDGADGYSGSYIAGYAYFAGASTEVDGSFMLARVVAPGSTTLPHEMGHALGLFHTFEGSGGTNCPANDDCTTDNDAVCDTEPCMRSFGSSCPSNNNVNPCTGVNYQSVQYNIMSYGNCRNQFTPGQRDRALLQLKTLRVAQLRSPTSIAPPVPVTAASCNPTPPPPNITDIGPANVTLANMSYISRGYKRDGNVGYIDNSCMYRATLNANSVNTLTVTTNDYVQNVVAYIDFNNDGQFSAAEMVMDHAGSTVPETHNATFTVPATATTDVPLRMRVLADYYQSSVPTSCAALDYGQGEDFGVSIQSIAPLPLVLQSLTAAPSQNEASVLVGWQTASETTLSDFVLERSEDASKFIVLENVKPHGFPTTYGYNDNAVQPGKRYYYRLRADNKNGTKDYSKVVTVMLHSTTGQLQVYPNPGTSEIKMKLPVAGSWQLLLKNALGQTVFTDVRVSGNNDEVHLSIPAMLPAGVYYLQTYHKETGQFYHTKWIKQ